MWNVKVMGRKQFNELWELEHIIRADIPLKLTESGQVTSDYKISERIEKALKAAYDSELGKEDLFQMFLTHVMIKIGRVEFVKKILGTLCAEIRP